MENNSIISTIFNWATSKIDFVEIEYLCFKLFKSNLESGLTELKDAVLILRKRQEEISMSINLTYNGIDETKPILNSFKKDFASISDLPTRIEAELSNNNEVKIRLLDFYSNILLTNGEKIRNRILFSDLQPFLNKNGFNDDLLEKTKLLVLKDELFKISATIVSKTANGSETTLKSKRFVFTSISNLPNEVANQLNDEGRILLTINE